MPTSDESYQEAAAVVLIENNNDRVAASSSRGGGGGGGWTSYRDHTYDQRHGSLLDNNEFEPPLLPSPYYDDISIMAPPSVASVGTVDAVPVPIDRFQDRREQPASSSSSRDLLEQIRPAHISVHVYKPSPTDSVGINVATIEKKPTITDINPAGQFALTPIQVGDVVESINGIKCAGKKASQVCDLIRNSPRDVILVVTTFEGDPTMVSSTVTKLNTSSSIGISLKKHRDIVKISNLNPDGLLANSLLNIGDRVIRINDTVVGRSPRDAARTIRECTDTVTIVAKRDEHTALVVWSNNGGDDTNSRYAELQVQPAEAAGCCRIV